MSTTTSSMPSNLRIAAILGLLSAIGPFAIDMYLPALPEVAVDLGVSESGVALTLTAYFIVLGLAQLIYGPLADMFGRKLPLLAGVAIFFVASVAAAYAPTLNALIAARALQGFGAATLMVVPRAVLRDLASGADAARMMAAIMIVTAISPMLAPLTGSIVMVWGGWQEIFLVLAGAALVSMSLIAFALPETLPVSERQPVELKAMLSGAARLLRERHFMALTMISGFSIASFFVFLANASFVYTRQYGLTPTEFSIAFAINAIGFFTASQLASTVARRYGMTTVILRSLVTFSVVSCLLLALVWLGFDALWIVVLGLLFANACLGLVMPSAVVMSLDPHPDIAGIASSLGGTLQMLTGGAMIALTGFLLPASALGMVGGVAICALLALATCALLRPAKA